MPEGEVATEKQVAEGLPRRASFEAQGVTRDENGNIFFKGKEPKDWSPKDFEDYGKAFGVQNLGPLSPIVEVPSDVAGAVARIPGGLDGKFTYYDLLWLKANPVDVAKLPETTHAKLTAKLASTMSPTPGDKVASFNSIVFGMLSPNAPLLPNEMGQARLRFGSMDEIRKFAELYPSNPTPENLKALNERFKRQLGFIAAGKGGLGIPITADITNIANAARLFVKNPDFFVKRPNESWANFVDKLTTQVKGFGTKTGSFGSVWQDPFNASISAMDRHMARIFGQELLGNPELRKRFDGIVVDRFNSLLTKAKDVSSRFNRKLKTAEAAQARIEEKNKGNDELIKQLKSASQKKIEKIKADMASELDALPDPSATKAKTIDDVLGQAEIYGVDRVQKFVNEAVFAAMGSRKATLLAKKGGINPNAPEHIKGINWIETPADFQVMSDAYRSALEINERRAGELGIAVFPAQWTLWDRIRQRVEPHEVMFPGLEKLPALNDRQLADAYKANKVAGYMSTPEAGRKWKRSQIDSPSRLAYFMPSDTDYLSAVQKGDTQAAQRMVDEAAKAAGYTVGPVYHGTPTGGFNVFDKRMRGETSGVSRQAFSFTTNQKAAENYSKRLGDEAVRLDAGLRVANDAMRRFDDDVAAQEYFSSKGYTSVEDGMLPEFDWGAIEDVPEFIKELRGYAKDLKPINPDLASSFIDAAKVMSSTKAVPEVKRVFLRIPENAPVFQATPSTLGMVMRDFSAEREPTKAGIVELPGNERIYYVADSSQVKLADPVTKDAQGNVIPLSKRFQASSEDIRFMPSEYLTRGPDGRVYVQPSVKTEDLSRVKGAVKGQERGVKAHGAYSQITGQVSIDRNAIKSLTKEQRASLIRHEMAHKLETESGLWDKSETALWDLWTRDKNHPIWDFMAETTGRSKFGGAEAAEIIANLYADHYPKGTFTVKERPYPYQNEPDVPGPYEYAIPTQIKEVLDSIDNKIGIWKKKKARKNISATNPTPQVEAGSQRFMPDYSGEHRAPGRDSGAPLDNLKGVYPDDVYGPNAARYYGHESGSQTDKAAVRIIQATNGKPDAPVKVFRAIPKSIQSNEINPGDWITTIKSYAVQHGEGPLGGDYKILEKTVPAGDLYTNGDSIFEFGYDPKFMPQPDSAMPGAYSFPGGYRALPGKAKGSLRLYGPAGSLIGIAASLDEAQRIIRRKTRQ